MTTPRRAAPPRALPRGRPGARHRVRDWVATSWVPAALLSGACLAAAGLWPVLSPPSAPLPDPSLIIPVPSPQPSLPSVEAGSATQAEPRASGADRRRSHTPAATTPTGDAGPRLVIGAVGISAPLDTVGLTNGEVEIPDDPARVGLWRGGAFPGEGAGTVLVTGHVSWRQERGALWPLASARQGDVVELALAADTTHWLVTSVRTVLRDADHPELFTRDGVHRLVVVTCGGPVVDGHYRDLVVVEAIPV